MVTNGYKQKRLAQNNAKNILYFREKIFYIYEKIFFIKVSQSDEVQQ